MQVHFFLCVHHPDNCLEHLCIFICPFFNSVAKKNFLGRKNIGGVFLPFAPLPATLRLWTQAHPFVVKVRPTLCLEISSDDQFRLGFPEFSTCFLCVLVLSIMESVACKISTYFWIGCLYGIGMFGQFRLNLRNLLPVVNGVWRYVLRKTWVAGTSASSSVGTSRRNPSEVASDSSYLK